MRPIELKLAGLQSYREQQIIDFSELCDAGVFGIFGPTGSGKSSILDAMTLALYARVERASGGTQGIMNHAENTLAVAFTFELAAASGTVRYRVERQFKRNNEVSISNTLSRFIQMRPEGDVVLADKLGEVNQHVQALLGLSVDDFTRAVVLPQGKFAEFLYLKGSDRRQMLQRLFNLEQYGDVLQKKLSQRMKDIDMKIKEVTAEQQGLGDASKQALEAVESALKDAQALSTNNKNLWIECENEYKEKQRIWEWQEQKAKDEQQLNNLTSEAPRILQLEAQVLKAEQAERLRPYLEQWDSDQEKYKQSTMLYQQTKIENEAAKKQHQTTDEYYMQAQQQLQTNEAPLLIKRNDYEQALLLERELEPLKQALNLQENEHNQIQAQHNTSKEQLQKERDLLQKARVKQTDLQNELEKVDHTASASRTIQSAFNEKQVITRLILSNTALTKERIEKEQELEKYKKVVEGLQVEQSAVKKQLLNTAQLLQTEMLQLSEQSSALTGIEQTIPAIVKQLQRDHEQLVIQQQAERLAQSLLEGSPCPVCGATDHPQPVGGNDGKHDHITDEVHSHIKSLEAMLSSVREQHYVLKQLAFSVESNMKQVNEAVYEEAQRDAYEGAVKEVAPTIEVPVYRLATRDLHKLNVTIEDIERVQDEFNHVRAELKQCEEAIHLYSNALKTELQQINTLSTQIVEHSSDTKALEAVYLNVLKHERSALEEQRQREQLWMENFPEKEFTRIDEEFQQLEAEEKKAEDLRGRLKISYEFIEHKEQRIADLLQATHELEKKQLQVASQLSQTKQNIAEKSKVLFQWVGEESAEKLINETKLKLKQLQEAEHRAKQSLQLAQQQLQLTENKISAASQAMQTAEQNVMQTKLHWQENLEKTLFVNEQEVREAFGSEEVRNQWLLDIKVHREQEKQLILQIKQLEIKLQDEVLTATQWSEWQEKLHAAKQAHENAMQQEARAERDREDVLQRHARWIVLEASGKTARHHFALLSKLQGVFRGNAFVEYIAEEQLMHVSRAASERLGDLTRQRYAIEVDSGGGFIIRDDANGGVKRPASTLSGGEAFLTSLALALALSAQIQLGGQYPLEFFFLDEGFGTLDQDMLEGVITALEKLHTDQLAVGVISHVPELRARLPRKLIVHPAEPSGRGSHVSVESI